MILKKRNKILKKMIAATLALLILAAMSSCSGAYGHGGDSEFSLSTLEVIPSVGTAEGAIGNAPLPSEYRILRENGAEDGFFASAGDQDIMSKTVFERNAMLYEQYGITISEKTENDIASRVKNDMLSGKNDYDMLILKANSAADLINTAALADLEALAGFDSDAAGYNEKVISELSIGGRAFLAAGDATPSLLRATSTVVVNTELLAKVDNGTKKLFDLARGGKFTYEAVLELSGALVSLNGAEGVTLPTAAISVTADDALSLFYSGGGRFFYLDEVTDVPYAASFDGENREIYSAVMSLFGISEDEAVSDDRSGMMTPLFTFLNIAELEALAAGGAPFAALPMPKMTVRQSEYICNVDMSMVAFTALPAKGASESSVAVMNLIYRLSNEVTRVISDACAPYGTNSEVLDIIFKSASCDQLSLFGFGDPVGLMSSCVNERLSPKAFAIRASERSLAAVTALSIVSDKFSN